jgi:hypothetical protein
LLRNQVRTGIQEISNPVSHLSRWFVALGLAALLPAAILLGGSIGEVMRHPSLGSAEILQHTPGVLILAVTATFLLSTASGLHERRPWALAVGIAEAAMLLAGGLVLLIGNAGLLTLLGLPTILSLAAIMLGLAALITGARLLRSLWAVLGLALPFGAADVRALGALTALVLAGMLGQILFARPPG